LPLDDPLADALRAARRGADGGLGFAPVFGELAAQPAFGAAVQRQLGRVQALGLRAALDLQAPTSTH
jgi:hypothetical protein